MANRTHLTDCSGFLERFRFIPSREPATWVESMTTIASHDSAGTGDLTCRFLVERCSVPSGTQVAGSRLGDVRFGAADRLGAAPPAGARVASTV